MVVPVHAGFQSRNGSRVSGLESLRFVSDAFDGLRDRPDDDNGVAANGDCNLCEDRTKTKHNYFKLDEWTNTTTINTMRHETRSLICKLLQKLCIMHDIRTSIYYGIILYCGIDNTIDIK